MAAVDAAHQRQIENAIAAGEPEKAFAILENYADLRHADMPPVSKPALAATAKVPAAVRQFALGTTSTSVSVRRFCRKYLPKVGAPAASSLLALAADALDPFRPGDGLFGCFGGVASAIARTILDEKMSFEIQGANFAYAEADRYGKEVMDDVIFLVAATSYENLVRFCEYQWGAGRIAGLVQTEKRDWPHAEWNTPWSHQTVQETLAKNAKGWGETLVRWTSGRTMLLDEPSDDPVVKELARRVRDAGDVVFAKMRENLLVQYARHFQYGLLQEHRIAVCRNLLTVVPTLDPNLKKYFDRSVQDYKEKYPDEAKQATEPATGVAATVDPAAKAATASGDAPAPASVSPAASAAAGPGGERALRTMLRLAKALHLPKLHAEINRNLEEDLQDDEAPESGGQAEHEQVLAAVHRAILDHRATRPGVDTSARPRWGEDRTYVPDAVLENAPFADALADLLIGMVGPDHGLLLAASAATLLSREGLRRFGEAWARRPRTDEVLYDGVTGEILDALAERDITPVALLHAIFSTTGGEFPIELTQSWCRALAMLYIRGGEPGRTVTLELLARHPYPKDVNEYNNRRDFYDPLQSVMYAAWERQDADVLGLAFERFAIPYFWKGSKALMSKREPFYAARNYAARSDTGEGVPLADVWALASKAGRTAATVKAALRHAELCEAPRTYLDLASPEDFGGLGDDVLALLESSSPTVLASGLAVLSRVPAVVADRAEEAVTAAARGLTSTRSGAAKEAAVALAALANAHARVRQQAYAALADGLELEATPVLQAIMKSMKTVPGKLPSDARMRILELSKSDPGKFEKLAKPLLAA